MKFLITCMFIATATAAVIPVDHELRQRRDVSEIVNEYLPPAAEAPIEVAAIEEATEPAEDTAVLGENGYEYKTQRRFKLRHRRDVSEIAPEYLPPAEEEVAVAVTPIEEVAQDSAVLADNGYKYKTVRRLKLRHRRDVSEIAPQYLPPAEESAVSVASAEEVPIEAIAEVTQDSAVLSDDGYQYKTIRRLKFRHRRDASEIAPEYLPPAEEVIVEAPAEEIAQDTAVLADDGYKYKTVRRLKLRHRRDVSEIAPQYLPPAEEVAVSVAPAEEVPIEAIAAVTPDSAVLADDGYQYKTVRRLKLRHRRDVSEIASQYLPPTEAVAADEASEVATAENSSILTDDGYQYKTIRRLKLRHR